MKSCFCSPQLPSRGSDVQLAAPNRPVLPTERARGHTNENGEQPKQLLLIVEARLKNKSVTTKLFSCIIHVLCDLHLFCLVLFSS